MDAALLRRRAHGRHALGRPEVRSVRRGPRRLEATVQVADAVGGGPGDALLDRPAPAEVDADAIAKRHARPLHFIPMRQSCTIPRGMMPPRPRGMLCCPPRPLAHPLAREPPGGDDTMLRDCPDGDYRFLPGISAFSSGTVAMPGHEIVHVTLASPVPWRDGLRADRPASAQRETAENGAVRHRASEPAALHLRRLCASSTRAIAGS